VRVSQTEDVDGTDGKAQIATLTPHEGKPTDNGIKILLLKTPGLEDYIRIAFPSLDQWYEEDVPIYTHPRDPYKRIDVLRSSRKVTVALDGVELASCVSPLFLFETGLRPRHYLPPTSVRWEYLSRSATVTYCPYKGKATYWDVHVHGKVYRDLVWEYKYPTAESAAIAGCLCFYDEKVDLTVEGVQGEK
jgi:uncharacterized protein (DUF427 family)